MLNKTELEALGYRFTISRHEFWVVKENCVSETDSLRELRKWAFNATTYGNALMNSYSLQRLVFRGTRLQKYDPHRGRRWPVSNEKELWKQMLKAANLDFVKQRVTS